MNLLCDRAMARGQQTSAAVIDAALIEAAATDLGLGSDGGTRVLSMLLIVTAFALLVLAGAAGALWVSRDAVSRAILQWEDIPASPGSPARRLPAEIVPIHPGSD